MRFDVAVIGGGPAGMMAAGRAAELGVCVALLEKNKGLGRKLLLTGNGRCNLTNHQPDPKKFISAFGKEGRFLLPSLMSFGVEDTLDFFHSRGLETKIEDGNRVFPKTDRAKDVLAVLDEFLREHNVTILDHTRVESMSVQGNRAEMYVGGRRFEADKIIIATGGKSYPSTGSTGDGMRWAEALGHSIAPTRPALAPIVLEEQWAMEGVSFQNIGVSAFSKGKKVMGGRGDVLFTSEGLSGPIILDMSSAIGKVMEEADVELRIDFMPDTEHPDLDHMLEKELRDNAKKDSINVLAQLVPQRLAALLFHISEIEPSKKAANVSREERKAVTKLLKQLSAHVSGVGGFDRAMVTAGGVDIKEIRPETMGSKLFENLYFAGEVLGMEGPSGGYNLQMAWSTGRLAGESAARAKEK